MPLRGVTGALMVSGVFAIAVAASPALACKGATSLLRDDFTDVDPAWQDMFSDNGHGTFQIGGGKAVIKTDPGYYDALMYQGDFYPSGDACVTITNPGPARDPSNIWAGMVLQVADGSWYFPMINLDGTAGVQRLSIDWLNPVPPRKFAAIRTGPNAVNVLRVVWKAPPRTGSSTPPDPTVTMFINDQQFISFKINPNANRLFGLAAGTEGNTYQFSDLAITR
jgi:hypothetical protein